MKEVLAVIPARSGSKSVPHKNIRLLAGKPCLAYSIEHAKKSKFITRVILSTDSCEYAEIGMRFGAEIPFIRPQEFATDTSTDFEVFSHALNFLIEKENYLPDIIVHLRPTYPIRNVSDIDNMVELALSNEEIDSVRSISRSTENPYKMWTMGCNGFLKPVVNNIPECYNMPRQELPVAYYQNACIDVLKTRCLLKYNSMTGNNIYGYVMQDNFDIDTETEFNLANDYLEILSGKKTFCFDIDGVIAVTDDISDYSKSVPNLEMISKINKLYEFGNQIILFTARGYVSKKDWYEVTLNQMNNWGVKFHVLKMGKPAADFYVDDHGLTLFGFNNLIKFI